MQMKHAIDKAEKKDSTLPKDIQRSWIRRTHPHRLNTLWPASDEALSWWDVVNTGTLSESHVKIKE